VIAASDVEDGHRWSPMSWINFARDYPNIVKLYLPKGVIHGGFPMSEMAVVVAKFCLYLLRCLRRLKPKTGLPFYYSSKLLLLRDPILQSDIIFSYAIN